MKAKVIAIAAGLLLMPAGFIIAANVQKPVPVPSPAPDANQPIDLNQDNVKLHEEVQKRIEEALKENEKLKPPPLSEALKRRPMSKEQADKVALDALAAMPKTTAKPPAAAGPPIGAISVATGKVPDGFIACSETHSAAFCADMQKATGLDKVTYIVKLPASGSVEELNAYIDTAEAAVPKQPAAPADPSLPPR